MTLLGWLFGKGRNKRDAGQPSKRVSQVSTTKNAPQHVITTTTAVMGSVGEEFSDFEEEDMLRVHSQTLQVVPSRMEFCRPSKRRRISSEGDDSIDDFIDDDDFEEIPKSKRTRLMSAELDSVEDDAQEKVAKKKKSRYKIHIPRDHILPATTVQYGTQLPDNPDSSPYRIRGAKWKLPKVAAAKGPASKIPNLKPATTPTGLDENDFSNPSATLNPPPSRTEKSKQTSSLISAEEDETFNQPMPSLRLSPDDIARELADLPSDAFSSSPETVPSLASRTVVPPSQPLQRLVAPQTALRQTTLFGGRAVEEEQTPSQASKVHNYRVDMVPEAPTHHKLDHEALRTWIYPTNLGPIREYQFNIVKHGLFNNMLVALPTGLGKTFIAATVMLNYFRWTRDAKIVFMAPTKPLVSQQVDACFNIAGIPRSATTMLTGEIAPALRAEEWVEKRVFFMTPQTLENDLRTGIADPKKIVLLVVDEAHRATGNYSYVKVVSFMRRFSKSFRILALTATPGASVEAVQEVIDGLEISKVEIRTEESMDIQQFTHRRKIEQILLDPSDEIIMVKDLFSKALQPLVDRLCGQNAYWNKDPMSLTAYGLMQAQKSWYGSDAGKRASPGLKGMIKSLFAILARLAHGIKLLNYHGIGPFYGTIKDFRTEVQDRGNKAGKLMKEINDSPHFKKLIDRIQAWINKSDFVGHPKLIYLCDTILNHFLDAGEGRLPDGASRSSTRVIVFAEYRDSAEEICRVLNRHGPMIRASVFVGQADSKRSEGMNQAKQLETIRKFKTGAFNVLVATSIGEEGLDIGQVDLIVCYDASGSPIRMLQRMGRTGRKRAGNIVLLLMRGKEEESFTKAKDNYEQMQKMISSGTRFNFRHDLSARIVPRAISPVADKRHIEIPFENTQDHSLPEPKRRPSKVKRPPKKFSMPGGVETGFQKASKLAKGDEDAEDSDVILWETLEEQWMPVPTLESVLLGPADLKDLERSYQNVSGDDMQEVSIPEMTKQPASQRSLGPTQLVRHGQIARRFVSMIRTMRKMTGTTVNRWKQAFDNQNPIEAQQPSRGHSGHRSPIHSSSSALSEESEPDLPLRLVKKPPPRKVQRQKSIRSRSKDQSDTDGSSDDDDDLGNFVTRDTEPLCSGLLVSRSSSSTPNFSPPTLKPFFEPTQFTATQDTNDDDIMPDIGDLVGGKSTGPPRAPLKQKRVGDNTGCARDRGGKRRTILEEDSDE